MTWPTGNYGLPMPKAGCPSNWFDGRRFHDDTNANLIDCKVYDSLHLAGWVSKEGIHSFSCLLKRLHTAQCSVVQYSTVPRSAMQYSTVQCCAVMVQCSAVQYSAVQTLLLAAVRQFLKLVLPLPHIEELKYWERYKEVVLVFFNNA